MTVSPWARWAGFLHDRDYQQKVQRANPPSAADAKGLVMETPAGASRPTHRRVRSAGAAGGGLRGRPKEAGGGGGRARPQCRFVQPLIHFIPDLLTYSVPLFLKR